jgi:hypothetical protein
MMAQQPTYSTYQTPQEPDIGEDEDIDQMFTMTPRKAVEKVMSKREEKLRQTAEEIANRTFWVNQNKLVAMQKYPDLKNPNSDFFKKVSWYMQAHPEKYNEAEGILDACARIQVEMPQQPSQAAQQMSQHIVQQTASAASQVSPASTAPTSDTIELDAQAIELAKKLNISVDKMKERLIKMQNKTGEYADHPEKKGRGIMIK